MVIFALGLDKLFKSIHLMSHKIKLSRSLYFYHFCNFFILSFYPHTFEKYKFNFTSFSNFLFIFCRFDAKGHEASQSTRQVPALQKFKISISEYNRIWWNWVPTYFKINVSFSNEKIQNNFCRRRTHFRCCDQLDEFINWHKIKTVDFTIIVKRFERFGKLQIKNILCVDRYFINSSL